METRVTRIYSDCASGHLYLQNVATSTACSRIRCSSPNGTFSGAITDSCRTVSNNREFCSCAAVISLLPVYGDSEDEPRLSHGLSAPSSGLSSSIYRSSRPFPMTGKEIKTGIINPDHTSQSIFLFPLTSPCNRPTQISTSS